MHERLIFIQLTYHFIELKLIELTQPHYLTFSSKDGLDITGTANLGFIALITTGHKRQWKEKESDLLCTTLFGPTLMNRERVIHPERFDRLVSMIKLLEEKGDYLKDFAPFFSKEMLQWDIDIT